MTYTNLMMRLISYIALFLSLTLSSFLFANRGLEIALLSDKNNEGYGDSSSSMTMELISKKGDVVTRELRFKRQVRWTFFKKACPIFCRRATAMILVPLESLKSEGDQSNCL